MTWCGTVSYGMVRYGIYGIWCGLVWYVLEWCGMVKPYHIPYGIVWDDMVWYSQVHMMWYAKGKVNS